MILALAGPAACASRPPGEAPCSFATPPVTGWTTYDEGGFTIRLPPAYERIPVQGIDSRVGRWEGPGGSVGYDLGAYANPLRPNELTPFPGLVVCQESDGRGAPRIIRYSPPAGGYAVSAHWPGSGTTGPLTVEGVVERPEDRGEILAIIHSVRMEP